MTEPSRLEFSKKVLEKRASYFPDCEEGRQASASITIDTFERAAWLASLHNLGSLQVSRESEHLSAKDLGSSDFVRRLPRLLDDGFSVAVNFAEDWSLETARVVRAIGEVFGTVANGALFLAPENGATFLPHYDAIDVLAIQLDGKKTWSIGRDETNLPLANSTFPIDSEVDWEHHFTLNKADCLYVPRGKAHSVRAVEDSFSLHLSVGIAARTHADVARRLIEIDSDKDKFLRSSYYSRPARNGYLSRDFDKKKFTSLDGYSMSVSSEGLYASDLCRLHQLPGRLSSFLRETAPSQNMQYRRREACAVSREFLNEGKVGLGFAGLAKGRINKVSPFLMFPAHALSLLEAIRDHQSWFDVDQLPSFFSTEERSAVVSRLVLEGLLEDRN